jgi:hypothetical protein
LDIVDEELANLDGETDVDAVDVGAEVSQKLLPGRNDVIDFNDDFDDLVTFLIWITPFFPFMNNLSRESRSFLLSAQKWANILFSVLKTVLKLDHPVFQWSFFGHNLCPGIEWCQPFENWIANRMVLYTYIQ